MAPANRNESRDATKEGEWSDTKASLGRKCGEAYFEGSDFERSPEG